jgi:hypothetical protein
MMIHNGVVRLELGDHPDKILIVIAPVPVMD